MSNPLFEIKIAHNIALGDKAFLFNEPVDTRGVPMFCFQFIITGVVGAPLDGLITAKVSNDGVNWFTAIPGSTAFPYFAIIANAGNNNVFIFFPIAPDGLSLARFVNFEFTANGLTAGTIEKAIYSGEDGTA